MRWLKMNEILPFLSKWHVLIATEMYRVETTRPTRQASVLINFLMNKGTAGIELLYVSLMESTKQSGGVPSHYQLAEELKKLGEHLKLDSWISLYMLIVCIAHDTLLNKDHMIII